MFLVNSPAINRWATVKCPSGTSYPQQFIFKLTPMSIRKNDIQQEKFEKAKLGDFDTAPRN